MMTSVKGGMDKGDVVIVVSDVFGTVPREIGEGEGITILEKVRGGGERKERERELKRNGRTENVTKRKLNLNPQNSPSQLSKTSQTVIVCVNKVDLLSKVTNKPPFENPDESDYLSLRTTSVSSAITKWRTILPNALCIIPMSAGRGENVDLLRNILLANDDVPKGFRELGKPVEGMFRDGCKTVTDEECRGLFPPSPPMFGVDVITDRSERFVASEIIRGVLFGRLKKEIPYACEVQVTGFTEGEKPRRLTANIVVERESQKGVVIGKGGKMIKDIGVEARGKLEGFFGEGIYLDLKVKVDKDWRKDEKKLKAYGYDWDR